MKRTLSTLAKTIPLVLVVGLAAACDADFFDSYYQPTYLVYVTVKAEPDDADVVVNGETVGLAYEFSTREKALTMASKDVEFMVCKRGFQDESIDLNDYEGNEITVEVKLKTRGNYGTRAEEKVEDEAAEAKSEKVATPPPDKAIAKAPATVTAVTLTVSPAESAIYLNGKFWGISPEEGKIANMRLAPGKYKVEVVKPGYKAFTQDVEIPKQEAFALKIALEK